MKGLLVDDASLCQFCNGFGAFSALLFDVIIVGIVAAVLAERELEHIAALN